MYLFDGKYQSGPSSQLNLVQQSGLTRPQTIPSMGLIIAMARNLLPCVKDGGDFECALEEEVGS